MSASIAQRRIALERAASCVRLASEGLNQQAIAERLGIHRNAVGRFLRKEAAKPQTGAQQTNVHGCAPLVTVAWDGRGGPGQPPSILVACSVESLEIVKGYL